MAEAQPMMQDIQAAKSAVRAMTDVADLAEYCTGKNTAGSWPKTGGPQLQQPKFNLSAQNKYAKLRNFKIEVRRHFVTKNYDTEDAKKVPIIKNWKGI